jgi:hypothetical protein
MSHAAECCTRGLDGGSIDHVKRVGEIVFDAPDSLLR